jgi:DNA polymerase-3 subunit gamma/tau
MDLILETLQHMAIIKISPESITDLNLPSEEVIPLSESLKPEEIQLLYQIGLIAKRDMDLAPNVGDGFEMALLRMMSFLPEEKDISKSKKKVAKDEVSSEQEDSSKPVPRAAEPSKKVTEEDDHSLSSLDHKTWNKIFKSLKLDSGTKQLISHCSFLKAEDSVIYFSMPKDKLEILNGSHREKFEDSLNQALDFECHIFFEEGEVNGLSPNKTKEKQKTKELSKASEAIKNDPSVKNILDTLGGTIVESSIAPKESQ